MRMLFMALAFVVVFCLGVYLAPIVRADYGEFKAYIEEKLKLAEQAAKDKASGVINKL